MIDATGAAIEAVRWKRGDVADFLGRYLSEPKARVFFDPPEDPADVRGIQEGTGDATARPRSADHSSLRSEGRLHQRRMHPFPPRRSDGTQDARRPARVARRRDLRPRAPVAAPGAEAGYLTMTTADGSARR